MKNVYVLYSPEGEIEAMYDSYDSALADLEDLAKPELPDHRPYEYYIEEHRVYSRPMFT